MAEFTMYSENVGSASITSRARASVDSVVNIYPKGSECESSIILVDVSTKFLSLRSLSIKKVLQSKGELLRGRQRNGALVAAETKLRMRT